MANSKNFLDGFGINEAMAKVKLQSLLDHTAKRILQLQKEIINNFDADSENHVILIGKLRFDGRTGQAECKQRVSSTYLEDNTIACLLYIY